MWVRITDSRSHFLLSDSGVLAHRRMPAGDRTKLPRSGATRCWSGNADDQDDEKVTSLVNI